MDTDDFDTESEGMIEPLPSAAYTETPPRAPSIEEDFSDFSEYLSDPEPESCYLALSDTELNLTRRSSSLEEGEHNVTEPPFLTSPWDSDTFPEATNNHIVPSRDWKDSHNTNQVPVSGCYTAQEWMRWATEKPLCERPPWVIPSRLYTYSQPDLFQFPANRDEYFRQQVVTNTYNNDRNGFSEPLRRDLVHHHKTSIPLVPTGRDMDINMEYMVETIFTTACAAVTIQLKDRTDNRLVKLDLWVTDTEINIRTAANHRRMNHVFNDVYEPITEEGHWWDME